MRINQLANISSNIAKHKDLTTNYEGGVAFNIDVKTRLYTRACSCLIGEPKFYKEINNNGSVDVNQDKLLLNDLYVVAKEDPEFILQLANYTRNELNLRTISVVLLVEASLIPECKKYIKEYTPKIIKRADELTEAVAYLQRKIGDIGNKSPKGSMPSALKKGLAIAFNNFNAYNLAKYNRKGLVKLKDVLKLVHPKPKDEKQSELFKKLLTDTLESPETWEVVISTKGSTKENWESIAPNLPIFAAVRNIRNLLDKQVSQEAVLSVVNKLTNKEIIKNSKMLPFRFFSAYREIENNSNPYTTKMMDSLETALELSIENLPKLEGSTLLVSDNSGSMDNPLSARGTVSYKDVANLMLSISHKLCRFPVNIIFGSDIAVVNFPQRNGPITNTKWLNNEGQKVGCSTDAWKVMQHLLTNKIKVDRIILFSDMQCYNSDHGDISFVELFKKYKSSINPNVYLYSLDLSGYGTLQVPQDEPRTCLIAGWSEKILEFISLFEQDSKQVVERIKNGKLKDNIEDKEEQSPVLS